MKSVQDLIRKLNSAAIKASTAKFEERKKSLHAKNFDVDNIAASGWYYSWDVWKSSMDSNLPIKPLHKSLHAEADELLEEVTQHNEQVILMSAYVAAMVTYTDSCRTMLHHYLPPFLHSTLTDMGIGADPNTKPYPFPLNPQEQEGKEILYSYALLEMTGT